MLPVRVQVPVAGSYSSAEAKAGPFPFSPVEPPAISTFPSGSKVAVGDTLASCMLAAELQLAACACPRVEPVQGRSRSRSSASWVLMTFMASPQGRVNRSLNASSGAPAGLEARERPSQRRANLDTSGRLLLRFDEMGGRCVC